MQPSLPEELLLLALHDEKGSVIPAAAPVLNGALVGAVLMELGLQGRLREDADGGLQVDMTPTGDPILDEAVQRVGDSDRPRTASYWVGRLARRIPRQRLDHAGHARQARLVADIDVPSCRLGPVSARAEQADERARCRFAGPFDAGTASIVQLLTGLPSNKTVQAPQLVVSQPVCVPVSRNAWRSRWASSRRGSTSAARRSPLTVRVIRCTGTSAGASGVISS